MAHDIATTDAISPPPPGLFPRSQLPTHANIGAISIESERAIAEVQGRLVVAKRFPRDPIASFRAIIESCSRPELASVAMYKFPRSGQSVEGPSIRLAEVLALHWGNISYGSRELSRREGVSEMEAFAQDDETNVRSVQQFTVRHIRDKKGGGVALTDERDIYELTANSSSRRMRARILAVIPPHIVDGAIEQCRKTLAGKSDVPLADRASKMVVAFGKFGVSQERIETRLGHQVADVTPEELTDLTGIHNSLRDGISKVDDWFPLQGVASGASALHQVVGGEAPGAAPAASDVPADGDEGDSF